MRVAREAMRTRFEIVLGDERDEALLRAAGEEALEEIAQVEAELSIFSPASVFFRLNVEAAERPVVVDAVLFGLLERAGELCARLDAAFDPTVGALVRHYRGESALTLEEARARVGFARNVRLDPESSSVSFARLGVELDPGALGKGWALERAAGLLRAHGLGRLLLHGGTSSVLGLGAPAGAQGWGIAIDGPAPGQGPLARVTLRDRALSVSAARGRLLGAGPSSVGHVLDPRSGRPVDHTLLAAVVAESATDAEGISTALLVLGAAGLDLVEERFPGASALVASPAPDAREPGALRVDLLGDAFEPAVSEDRPRAR